MLVAVLIVKDEAATLPRCLPALGAVVDRVHVHDTGSSDATVAVAGSLGASVSTGGWDGDFARARNEAVALAGPADWVLAVDADETLVAAPAPLRALLADPALDAVVVDIDNQHDEGPYTHDAVRLYRPPVAAFSGAVHERVTRLDGRGLRATHARREVLRLEHAGYATATTRARKAARNSVIARQRLLDLGESSSAAELSRTTLDLGRSLLGAGQVDEAVAVLASVVDRWPASPDAVQALEFLGRVFLAAGRDAEVVGLVARLRAAGGRADYASWLEAQARAQLGEVAAAVRLLDGVGELVDSGGRRYDAALLRTMRDLLGQLAGRTDQLGTG